MDSSARRRLARKRRRATAKRNAFVDVFRADFSIDAVESEFMLQHLQIAFDNILVSKSQLVRPPGMQLSDNIVLKLELIVRRVRDRVRGGVSSSLLRCVHKVVAAHKQTLIQQRLQELYVQHVEAPDGEDSARLPPGMDTPRSTACPRDRMQYFSRLRAEQDFRHYLLPVEPQAPAKEAARRPRSMPCTPLQSRTLQMAADQCPGSPCSSKSMSPGAVTQGLGLTWKISWPDSPKTPSAASSRLATPSTRVRLSAPTAQARGKNMAAHPSTVSEMAHQARVFRSSGHVCDAWTPHQARLLREDIESVRKAPQKLHRVPSDANITDAGRKPVSTTKHIPPPRLPGMTGGFSANELLNCPRLSMSLKAYHKDTSSTPSALPPLVSKARNDNDTPDDTASLDTMTPAHLTSRLLQGSLNPASQSCATHYHLDQLLLERHGFSDDTRSPHGGARKPKGSSCLARSMSGPALPKERYLPQVAANTLDPASASMTIVTKCFLREVGYASGCASEGICPRLGMKFFTAHGPRLDLASMCIGDSDLEAILHALQMPLCDPTQRIGDQQVPVVTAVDFACNRQLSDSALAQFLSTALCGSPTLPSPSIGPLLSLSLAHCVGIREQACGVIAELLQRNVELRKLEELDLSGVAIPRASWPGLAEGVAASPSLRCLRLAGTGCGAHDQQSCVLLASSLMEHTTLRTVDLSGNCFHHEGCQAIRQWLRQGSKTLESLDVSHNAGLVLGELRAASADGKEAVDAPSIPSFNPIMLILEVLGETELRHAAFANCSLGFAEDCVLEDAVQSSDITSLDVSDNPHGVQGLSCLLRLLVRRPGGAAAMKLERLDLRTVRDNVMPSDAAGYEYSQPSACYQLHLEKPQHRSVLRLLLKRGEEATGGGGKEFACFENDTLDRQPANLPTLCRKRMDCGGDDWQVPEQGALAFSFKFPLCFRPLDDADTVMKKFAKGMKVRVSLAAFVRLKVSYASALDERSRSLVLTAMSRDLCFKLCQVKALGRATPELNHVVVRTLLPSIEEQSTRRVLFDLAESAPFQARRIKAEARSLLYFNYAHPDGHYSLNLANLLERSTAQRCILISSWMRHRSIALNRTDCSEHGNYESLRGAVHGNQPFVFDSEKWQLLDDGTLEFDFAFPRLPLKEADMTDPTKVGNIVYTVGYSSCKFSDQVRALQLVAHKLVLSPQALYDVVAAFPLWNKVYELQGLAPTHPRMEAYISLYNRTLFHSEVVSPKFLYNPLMFHEDQAQEIRRRLGWIHTLDVVGVHLPESNTGNRHGPMRMDTYEGWLVLKYLLALWEFEPGNKFDDACWSEKQELYDMGYVFVIPKSWVPDPPRHGEFTATLVAKEDGVDLARRRELAKTLFAWTFPPNPGARLLPRRSLGRRTTGTGVGGLHGLP